MLDIFLCTILKYAYFLLSIIGASLSEPHTYVKYVLSIFGWRVIKICQLVLRHLFVWGRWMVTQVMRCALMHFSTREWLHFLNGDIISHPSMRGQ